MHISEKWGIFTLQLYWLLAKAKAYIRKMMINLSRQRNKTNLHMHMHSFNNINPCSTNHNHCNPSFHSLQSQAPRHHHIFSPTQRLGFRHRLAPQTPPQSQSGRWSNSNNPNKVAFRYTNTSSTLKFEDNVWVFGNQKQRSCFWLLLLLTRLCKEAEALLRSWKC